MDYIVGNFYTRNEIQTDLGGEIQSYLPQRAKRIVAGCFRRDHNPYAPLEVQAGSEPKVVRKAETLAAQADKRIPVFVKERGKGTPPAVWEYKGIYEFYEVVDDAAALASAEADSERHGELSCLLRFRKVES
jgi:hypothetical protein